MKKLFIILVMLCTYQVSNAQMAGHSKKGTNSKGVTKKDLHGVKHGSLINASSAVSASSLSNDDIAKGLKEALTVGIQNAGNLASKLDGYYKNPQIKIPYPSQVRDMMTTLNSLGMEKEVNAFVKQLNRAAEDAAIKAAPIFISAITNMNINDGLTILKGGDNAATQFLKQNTSNELTNQFRPVITTSLQKVEITKYWNPLFKKYNQLPFVKKVNPNLDDYVTGKAIDGLFTLVAQEELKIRKDPMAQITDLLKKIFGAK